LENYKAMEESVTSNQEAFSYTEERFNVGLVNSVDYNLAKNNLTRAQSDLLQAKYDFIFKTKILDFFQGKELSL
ncbi:MAG: TolC family protein, partial [Bacteroidales bacterium]